MYITSIIKTSIDDNIFLGFNMYSTPLLLNDVEKELLTYRAGFQDVEAVRNMNVGDRLMIERIWNKFMVFITIYKS